MRSPASFLLTMAMTNKYCCPNCGEFFSSLNEITGFCGKCTNQTKKKVELFLEKYADHIEHYIAQGCALPIAIKSVRTENQPRCLSCGVVIIRAPRNSVFCRSNKKCRHYSRKYVYLYREKGLSKAEALAQVSVELT